MKKLIFISIIWATIGSGPAFPQDMNCDRHGHSPGQVCDEQGENCSHKHDTCNMHKHDCTGDHGENCQHEQKKDCCADDNQQSSNDS